eukprot:TRINITY_DN1781_c0_g3_i1.p1 TRINITY_DN1781_c0_g3~~TRINITY_DN1781_c0_g3_i1.p1  ORF type:complete len:345 (+),score=65.25 TRINITY_DN1781_c0_g3_i1:66-1037(+)
MAEGRLAVDPLAHFNRFLDRQQREEQFTQDFRKLVYGGSGTAGVASDPKRGGGYAGSAASQSGGYGASGRRGPMPAAGAGGSASRTRSPGLAAGAALMMGGAAGTAGGATSSAAPASDAPHLAARAACRQMVERSRRTECPFDDHGAFGASAADRQPQAARHIQAPEPDEAAAAGKMARSVGRHNRDLQQKIGAGAPFDAPFDREVPRSSSRSGTPTAPAVASRCFADARTEAAANRGRMRGCEDLISGNYEINRSAAASGRPPLPGGAPASRPDLLPQAHMKLQYEGGSLGGLTRERAEYLNAAVLAEGNRYRNEFKSVNLS